MCILSVMSVGYVIIVGLLIINLKWLIILIVLPFHALYNRFRKKKYYSIDKPIDKMMAIPYYLFEMKLLRSGWERWMIFQVGQFPSLHFRKFVYSVLGTLIGKEATIHFKTEIRAPYLLKIGRGSIIGDNVILDARNCIEIGENVNFSSNVSVYTEQHDHRDPLFRCTGDKYEKKVSIGNRAWIGSNVIILPGVKIGEGAVCCAGCVVTKDVDPFTVVAGIPAKKVNERPKDLIYVFKACEANRLF